MFNINTDKAYISTRKFTILLLRCSNFFTFFFLQDTGLQISLWRQLPLKLRSCVISVYCCMFSAPVGSHSLHCFWSLCSLTSWPLVRIQPIHSSHVYYICGLLCVLSTCSLSCHTRNYPDVVLQFSGFNRQCAQCISLLYLVRYMYSMCTCHLTPQTKPRPFSYCTCILV